MINAIGKYRIDAEIGRGGFGTVYRAWDPTVGRAVAVKVLTVQGDEDLLTRFRNEAAAQGNLHHPNIVTVHDFGEHNGTPYMVMQLLEGETIGDVLTRKTPLTIIQKMNIMEQVAAGLHHAHLHGIVHRDVKPANIMILPDGTVQIMDFGIARLTASTSRHTRTGFVVGTVHYMAPEQFVLNRPVDHRADIWAFGVIYYELLTGNHPFAAAEQMSVLYRIAHADPEPVRAVAPQCPPVLDDVIARLLAKDPDLRYQSLRDVQFDVQPILLDLKRERATEMVEAARRLQADDKLEEARAAAQEILELDPGNRDAHNILHAVKDRLHRKLIQPKVNTLVQKAEENVKARAWQVAIQELESALRLSSSDPTINSRLQQIKKLYDVSQKAERMVADAKLQLEAENFTAAFRIATEAAQADPGNASASHLLSQIQRAIDVRESHRLLEEGVGRARGKLLLQQFDEAISDLSALAVSWPGNRVIAELLETARSQKTDFEHRERRRREVAAIRTTLNEERLDEASSRLEALLDDYPGDSEIGQLLEFARTRKAWQTRAQAVSRIKADAERLASAGHFDTAITMLETAQRDYDGDTSLASLLQSVTLTRTEYRQQQKTEAIRDVLQRANQSERNGDAAGALQIIEDGRVEFPDADSLTSAAARLQEAARQPQRDALARHVAAIESALASRDFKQALSLIEAARRNFPAEGVLDQLASKVAAARNAFELELARGRVRQELDAGRPDIALGLLSIALNRFPSDQQLLAMEREARSPAKPESPKAVIVAASSGAAAAVAAAPPAPQPEPRRSSLVPIAAGAGVLVLAAAGLIIALRPTPSNGRVQPVPQQTATPAQPASQAYVRRPQAAKPTPERALQAAPPAAASGKQIAVEKKEPEEEPATSPEPPPDAPRAPVRPQNAVLADNTGRVGAAPSTLAAGPTGKLVWSGQLQPGEQVILTAPQGTMPPFTDIVLTSIVPYGRVSVEEVAANGLTVANKSTAVVTSIEISWRAKGQQ